MNSRDYWAMRSAQDMVDRMGTAEQTAAEMNKAIQQSSEYLAKEVKAVFRGIESFGISESEARKILNAAGNKTALQNLRAAAQRVSDPDKRQALMSAIDSAGADTVTAAAFALHPQMVGEGSLSPDPAQLPEGDL